MLEQGARARLGDKCRMVNKRGDTHKLTGEQAGVRSQRWWTSSLQARERSSQRERERERERERVRGELEESWSCAASIAHPRDSVAPIEVCDDGPRLSADQSRSKLSLWCSAGSVFNYVWDRYSGLRGLSFNLPQSSSLGPLLVSPGLFVRRFSLFTPSSPPTDSCTHVAASAHTLLPPLPPPPPGVLLLLLPLSLPLLSLDFSSGTFPRRVYPR